MKSHVVQYTNFWPCEWNNDQKYMSRAFEFAKQNSIGARRPGHRALQEGADEKLLSVLQPIQRQIEPGGDGDPGTDADVHEPRNRKSDLLAKSSSTFAQNYLGVNVIFWSDRRLRGCAANPFNALRADSGRLWVLQRARPAPQARRGLHDTRRRRPRAPPAPCRATSPAPALDEFWITAAPARRRSPAFRAPGP